MCNCCPRLLTCLTRTTRTSPGHLTPPLSPRPRRQYPDEDEDFHSVERALVARTPRAPPPFVEDEAESLAREHAPSTSTTPEEEIPSRGDVEQHPVLLEVHEHNPERRFVIVPNANENDGIAAETIEANTSKEKQDIPREAPPPSNEPRKHEPVFDDHLSADRPALNRRKSRQDLPPLDTHVESGRSQRRSRAHSAVGPRPDGFSAQPSGQYRDDMLSPEYVKHGSSRRDKAYYRDGVPTTATSRSSKRTDDRRRDEDPRRKSPSPAKGMRSESNTESRRSRRRMSIDQGSDSHASSYGREDTYPPRSGTRDPATGYKRGDDDATPLATTSKTRDPLKSREDSRSSDESVAGSQSSERRRRRRNSTLIHQESERSRGSERLEDTWDRSRSRGPPVPPHGKPIATTADGIPMNPRSSVTFPIVASTTATTHLPYPDDDHPRDYSSAMHTAPSVPLRDAAPPSASMPSFPPPVVEGSGFGDTVQADVAAASTWQVPSFDPVRDAIPVDTEVGSYRRYSEGHLGGDIPRTLECARKKPIAGKMDWLTLPRTDINICPDCYQAVFSNSKYRTLFQPMLRPTDKAIACDLGSIPWYRIAWLLTLKNERPDLQLFHQVDNVINGSRNQPCPGTRPAVRNWLTIRDPYKRRVVPHFTVCYQCAKTVEVLLPSLMGIFIPLDSRSEPIESVCSLHFTPQRKRFALYFDTFETTADRALKVNGPPNGSELAARLERLSVLDECKEDSPVRHRYWHSMQFLPQFTVCEECFSEVVRPRIKDDNALARNFYRDPVRMKEASCQLYSTRMREIFRKACRRNDPKYLEEKVKERQKVEADIHSKLLKLDKMDKKGEADTRTVEEEVAKLIREWKEWE